MRVRTPRSASTIWNQDQPRPRLPMRGPGAVHAALPRREIARDLGQEIMLAIKAALTGVGKVERDFKMEASGRPW